MGAPSYELRGAEATRAADGSAPAFVLGPLDLRFDAGTFTGVVGPNGAGKSTLLQLLAGTLAPSRGTVLLEGADAGGLDRREIARRVAVLPASTLVAFSFTALEVALMGRAPHQHGLALASAGDLRLAREALDRAGASGLEARRLDTLSTGERQRVAIARALAQAARLVLLDEPTAHLDLPHQSATCALFAGLARAGTTVVAALHDLNLAALYCDRVLLLAGGRLLADGTPAAVLGRDDADAPLRRAYGDAFVLARHPESDAPAILPRVTPLRERGPRLT